MTEWLKVLAWKAGVPLKRYRGFESLLLRFLYLVSGKASGTILERYMTQASKVIVYIAVSLDGFIAKKDGDISWLASVDPAQEDYGYAPFMESVETIIMGRKTYEKVLSLVDKFPHQDKQCYVLSRNVEHGKDPHVTFYQGDINVLVNKIKSTTSRNIYIDGGAEVIHALRQGSLIDEYILFIAPILLGSGISLFKEIQGEEKLMFVGSQPYPSGYVRLHYQTNNDNIALTQLCLPTLP